MGSSDQEAGVLDCSVGSIVWVRRRNGSWWPGKILGPDELSAAHLMSPRSGTPVKLLGREDASVDWYNLEKSKRVKAFRCGEFDDCIERAESTQGMPPKKREKYARREDAILHALELEKELLEKKFGKLGCSSNGKSSKSSDAGKIELGTPLECLEYGNENHGSPNSHQVSKQVEESLDDKSMTPPLKLHRMKEGSQLTTDEDNLEVLPRMRALQDFGLRIASSRQKLSSPGVSNGCEEPASDNNVPGPSDGLSIGNTVHGNDRGSLEKMNRTHEGLAEESLVRRRDRQRPLVQVLQKSTKFPVDHSFQGDSGSVSVSMSEEEHIAKRSRLVYLPGESGDCLEDKLAGANQMELSPAQFKESNFSYPAAPSGENSSGSTEDTETDSSDTDSVETDTDEELMSHTDAVLSSELEPQFLRRSEAQPEHGSMSIEGPGDMELPDDISPRLPNDCDSASVGVSKWQLKGKRKNRSFTKRYLDISDRKISRDSIYLTDLEEGGSNVYDEADVGEENYMARGLGNRGYLSKSKSRCVDGYSHKIIDWDDLAYNDQSALTGFWEDSTSCFDPVFVGRRHFGGRRDSMLVEVDLKVQLSYQREHVPMISLMSKLNGQAIVGHPIQIEALEEGASDILLTETDDLSAEMLDNDTPLPSMWKTARRTANFRVPRPRPSTMLDGDEPSDRFKYFNRDRKSVPKKNSRARGFSRKASTMRKSLSHASRTPMDKKLPKKPSKKMSLSSSQKIRTLSSIATERKLNNDLKHDGNGYTADGLIKPESGPTAVACIPVKLVFSRLYEELVGRH